MVQLKIIFWEIVLPLTYIIWLRTLASKISTSNHFFSGTLAAKTSRYEDFLRGTALPADCLRSWWTFKWWIRSTRTRISKKFIDRDMRKWDKKHAAWTLLRNYSERNECSCILFYLIFISIIIYFFQLNACKAALAMIVIKGLCGRLSNDMLYLISKNT